MTTYGHNLGYIDEVYRRYLSDPESVGEAWREFFKDYRPDAAVQVATEPRVPAAAARPAPPTPDDGVPEGALPLRGIGARIVENMEASLAVPTATSARMLPVKLLEENRIILNRHQATIAGPKISFTHLIAWAIVRALDRHPRMNSRYAEADGTPYVVPRATVNLGLAIDLERKGERVLLVPRVVDAGSLDFPSFVAAYNDVVARARANRLEVDDFQDISLTLTNPGTIGTVLSVPRLMPGQGAIIGTGAIGYSAEYAGMSPSMISELGVSKVMTITSTYDHRVIQGAESGAFLLTIETLLQGGDEFYGRIFAELGVPQEPMRWSPDANPQLRGGGGRDTEAIAKQAGVLQLVRSYRVRGHLWADLDPLGYTPQPNPELELSTYGLTVWDLDREFVAGGLGGHTGTRKLREILETLQRTYCWHVGVEYMHIQDSDCRHWLQERLEQEDAFEIGGAEVQTRILRRLNVAEAFETFLHTNYIGQKRFSLEGAETVIPMLDTMLDDAAAAGVKQAVFGMAHRGRLNLLAHMIGKPYGQIFREFEGVDPRSSHGSGDVKYHLGATGQYRTASGATLDVVLSSNPSHLEAVNPVVEGMARARQDRDGDLERATVLPVLIHGDAAFSGQGVVAETLGMSQLSGYRTGGTIHVVVNNQIGFTTGPLDARSSLYATDVAKMVHAPIFHVNGDHPEEAVAVMRHALAFRQHFKRDVVIDLLCYRRWGHNEGDDPSYTHPLLYAAIEKHRSVRKLYAERLMRRGDLDEAAAEAALEDYRDRLREVHDEVRRAETEDPGPRQASRDDGHGTDVDDVQTNATIERLRTVLDGLVRTPDDFEVHPKLGKQLDARRKQFDEDRIDWALAEALSFGTLALEGTPVRLSGEDSGRGTFSQRHAILYDHQNATPHVPLDHLAPDQARFTVYDSLLSEFAVLGFEYGYSVDRPDALVMWEAQFGDFVNGAQVIIDQFLTSAWEKWGQRSRVVLLLPHGYEGQGPEHSSARLERFLQACAGDNLRVAVPSTPAQYFHLLRRQVRFPEARPLVVMTPKSLLRHRACVSTVEELSGGRFQRVLDDPRAPVETTRRIVLCSGKVFYDLDAARAKRDVADVTIHRLEQLYPFPRAELREVLARYPDADPVWVQEEPRNMGAWNFVAERMPEVLQDGRAIRYIGRARAASPATGSHKRHVAEQEAIVDEALADG